MVEFFDDYEVVYMDGEGVINVVYIVMGEIDEYDVFSFVFE